SEGNRHSNLLLPNRFRRAASQRIVSWVSPVFRSADRPGCGPRAVAMVRAKHGRGATGSVGHNWRAVVDRRTTPGPQSRLQKLLELDLVARGVSVAAEQENSIWGKGNGLDGRIQLARDE